MLLDVTYFVGWCFSPLAVLAVTKQKLWLGRSHITQRKKMSYTYVCVYIYTYNICIPFLYIHIVAKDLFVETVLKVIA